MIENNIFATILAGGKSSRFGTDKSLVKLGDKSLLDHTIDKITKTFNEIIIVSNNKSLKIKDKNIKIIPDCLPGQLGPLIGVLSAMKWIKENQNLLSQQKINSSILQRYESLEQENERLKQILNAASNLDNKVEITRIISVNVNPYRHTIVIDKGERDGVYEGQVLLDADGVIGQILHTNFLTSEAILISDSDHALPVEINRNGLRTIVLGNGSYTKLDVPYIPNNADIEIGDLLVTSGLGGKFPPGYPVAKVDFIESDLSEQFYKVSAKPIAYLNQVREVMLLQPE